MVYVIQDFVSTAVKQNVCLKNHLEGSTPV